MLFDEGANLVLEGGGEGGGGSESGGGGGGGGSGGSGDGIDYQLMDDDTGGSGGAKLGDSPVEEPPSQRASRLCCSVAIAAIFLVGLAAYIATPDDQNAHGAFKACPVYPLVNRIGISTAIVGFVGLVLAMAVILLVYAYRRDRHELRERIILGLTISSAIYSMVCIVPLQGQLPDCSDLVPAALSGWFRVACKPPSPPPFLPFLLPSPFLPLPLLVPSSSSLLIHLLHQSPSNPGPQSLNQLAPSSHFLVAWI